MSYNVLIVIDGGFTFDLPAEVQDFTLTTLVASLTGAGMSVTKANRGPDTTASPGFAAFTFDGAGVNLLDYDAIWLIGDAGRNDAAQSPTSTASQPLPENELAAIARFMDAGGGLFAVGDHDSLGSVMAGQLPRVRAMRSWYGKNDTFARRGDTEPMGTDGHNWLGQGVVPPNFPQLTVAGQGRADTVQTSPLSTYPNDFGGVAYVWFENQSDSRPQTITPTTSPAHPILRSNGADIVVYPDHMHEGNTLGVIPGFDYSKNVSFNGASFVEFPIIDGSRELPGVVATGQSIAQASRSVTGPSTVDGNLAGTSVVNSLSVYDGRNAGVGRIVTGSTFHHYIDINLNGASNVTGSAVALAGSDAQLHQGLHDAAADLTAITTVYVNITQWLARPRPALQLILERSTFSQDEATANAVFDHAILVTVDGLKPNQFPGGGITSLAPGAFNTAWAPTLTPANPAGIQIEPVGVASDDPTLPQRLQRFTFTYRVHFTDVAAAFGFAGAVEALQVTATLTSAALANPLGDFADIELIKSANPFMLDLDGGNTTTWLSSDVKVFPVVAGDSKLGVPLAANASRTDALEFLQTVLSSIDIGNFTSLTGDEEGSALSPFPTTTAFPPKKVYNFALARVRLGTHLAPADNVRVFFRIVPAPTTAALTYQEIAGAPVGSYKQTSGADPIALPGIDGTGTQWVSFPCFAAMRMVPPDTQTDGLNVKTLPANSGGETSFFYGALIDNNLDDAYLAPTPTSAAAPVSLPTLLMGEHLCLVAQVAYDGAPIPSGANPATSDKLSQRNLAFSPIANPGLDASRVALHTFEIEATPYDGTSPRPDELLLQWVQPPPARTQVSLYMPGWNAQDVIDLADRLYARHEITLIDAHTVCVPGGGVRYIPIPRSDQRQTGVITAAFPLGVVKGQRFDLSVRQVTSRSRAIANETPKVERISQAEAAALIKRLDIDLAKGKSQKAPKGVFDLGPHKTLITDLGVVDDYGDHALVIDHIPPARVAAARRAAGAWRETIGAFQLAAPVSTRADMLPHHLRLLSVLRWRAEHLPQRGRWNDAFLRYLDLIVAKVLALGGDPHAVPATPNGDWPGLWGGKGSDGGGDHGGSPGGYPVGGGHPPHHPDTVTGGKIASLHYDLFGDFEGFTLHTLSGADRRFFSHEPPIERLAREAWLGRYRVTVWSADADPGRVRELTFGRVS